MVRRTPVALALAGLLSIVAATNATSEEDPSVSVRRSYFLQYCASCHGTSGRGDGALASDLKIPPADLTTIARRNGGEFPFLEVAEVVDGRRATRGHGTREMPIWGERFDRLLGPSPSQESAVRGRVLLFVHYLRSIQE